MKLNIKIETSESCYFNIKDITCGDSGYLPESSEVEETGKFKYIDTISIVRLTLNQTSGPTIKDPLFISHSTEPEYNSIPTDFDGWFTMEYIVIPTKDWFDKSSQFLQNYDTVYYSDGVKIYKYFQEESSESSIEELFERNIEGTTISKLVEDFVSICYLKRCFINICKEIFDKRGFSKCKPKGDLEDVLIYNRDLVWMTINVVSYLAEFGQLEEAQRLLEKIEGECNGICKFYNRDTAKVGCGCA